MRKEKLKTFFDQIRTSEDLLIYHLLKRNWKFVNSHKSGILFKNGIFFVAKKLFNEETFTNFTYSSVDIDLMSVNSIDDLYNSDIPLQMNFTPINVDRCNWYVCYQNHLLEKGMLNQNLSLSKSYIEGLLPAPNNEISKIEKFKEIVELIDSYTLMPKYALAKYYYVEKMVKDKAVKKYVFKELSLAQAVEEKKKKDIICLKCVSSAPIYVPKDKFESIAHVADKLEIKKLEETDTQVKIQLPFKKNYMYAPTKESLLTTVEKNLGCDTKAGSQNIIMLPFTEIDENLDELNTDESETKVYIISQDIYDILKALQTFTVGLATIKQVLVEALSLVKPDSFSAFDKLPDSLEEFDLTELQKEYIFKALNEDLNYTIFLDRRISSRCYEPLLDLLRLGLSPLRFLGKNFSPELLEKYKTILEAGFDLDIFLDLSCSETDFSYYAENIMKGINEECEELLSKGFSQYHLQYIRKAKSRKEDFSYIKNDDNRVQLFLKDYQHRNHIESSICNTLADSYNCTDTYTKVRFSDLGRNDLIELSAHLFSQEDFKIDGVPWSKIQQYILTKSELLNCSVTSGIQIQISGNLYLSWDSNSITFYNVGRPICKILFINNKVIVNESESPLDYFSFN